MNNFALDFLDFWKVLRILFGKDVTNEIFEFLSVYSVLLVGFFGSIFYTFVACFQPTCTDLSYIVSMRDMRDSLLCSLQIIINIESLFSYVSR